MRKLHFILLICAVLAAACSKSDDTKVQQPIDEEKPELPDPPASVADCEKCIILAEQSGPQAAIADVPSKTIIWQWRPSNGVKSGDAKWFTNISEAKVVYDGKYVLVTASSGGVALIRIADKKMMFYAYAGGNTHSAELLPDGNIVSASSTDNYLTLFKVDTLNFPDNVYSKHVPIEFGHNVVWDHKNQVLWSAAMNKLKMFTYNFDCENPNLTLTDTYNLPGTEAHDLFPVYGENALWLTNTTNVYKFDVSSKTLKKADEVLIQPSIKSITSGPEGFPTIIIKPKTSWWTDEVLDARGNTVFFQSGLKIYKARWVLPNTFSYPENDTIKQCD